MSGWKGKRDQQALGNTSISKFHFDYARVDLDSFDFVQILIALPSCRLAQAGILYVGFYFENIIWNWISTVEIQLQQSWNLPKLCSFPFSLRHSATLQSIRLVIFFFLQLPWKRMGSLEPRNQSETRIYASDRWTTHKALQRTWPVWCSISNKPTTEIKWSLICPYRTKLFDESVPSKWGTFQFSYCYT